MKEPTNHLPDAVESWYQHQKESDDDNVEAFLNIRHVAEHQSSNIWAMFS
jgi:hypothetical protein